MLTMNSRRTAPLLFLMLLLALGTLVLGDVTPATAIGRRRRAARLGTPTGRLDQVDPNGVVLGWALDPDTAARSIHVHLYVDGPAGQGRIVGDLVANSSRPDVNRATGHPGDHGFEFTLPAALRDGRPHTLYAYAIDSAGRGPNPQLPGSGMRFGPLRGGRAGPSPQPPAATSPPPARGARGLTWVRTNPMFISGLTVHMPSGPSRRAVSEYHDAFGANAVHLWSAGLPDELARWRAAGRRGMRWLSWVRPDGTSVANGQLLGGLPPASAGRIGYQIGDEPHDLADLRRIEQGLRRIRARDPGALLVVNFGHSPIVDTLVDRLSANPNCDVLSYDNYDRRHSQIWTDIERVRRAGLRNRKPYWRYLYSFVDRNGLPSESDMRWNAFMGLTYGFTGHTWFLYQIGSWHGRNARLTPAFFQAPGDFLAAKTHHWHRAAGINRELAWLGRCITQLTSTDVRYHSGHGGLGRPGPTRSWSRGAGGDRVVRSLSAGRTDLLVGYFRDARNQLYVMVQNLDHSGARWPTNGTRPVTVEVDLDFAAATDPSTDPSVVQVLDKRTGRVQEVALQSRGGRVRRLSVRLAAGDPVLFKLKTNKPFVLGP